MVDSICLCAPNWGHLFAFPSRLVMTDTPNHRQNYIISTTFPIPASCPITVLDLLSLHPSNLLYGWSHMRHRYRHYWSVGRSVSSSIFPQISLNAKLWRMRYQDGSPLRCANNKGGLWWWNNRYLLRTVCYKVTETGMRWRYPEVYSTWQWCCLKHDKFWPSAARQGPCCISHIVGPTCGVFRLRFSTMTCTRYQRLASSSVHLVLPRSFKCFLKLDVPSLVPRIQINSIPPLIIRNSSSCVKKISNSENCEGRTCIVPLWGWINGTGTAVVGRGEAKIGSAVSGVRVRASTLGINSVLCLIASGFEGLKGRLREATESRASWSNFGCVTEVEGVSGGVGGSTHRIKFGRAAVDFDWLDWVWTPSVSSLGRFLEDFRLGPCCPSIALISNWSMVVACPRPYCCWWLFSPFPLDMSANAFFLLFFHSNSRSLNLWGVAPVANWRLTERIIVLYGNGDMASWVFPVYVDDEDTIGEAVGG